MLILVAYSSRHDAIEVIAERVARTLRAEGHEAHARPVTTVHDVDCYDAFVIGSRTHNARWTGEAVAFLHENRRTLRGRPVWLFSNEPFRRTPSWYEAEGVAAPADEMAELDKIVKPIGHRVFSGISRRHSFAVARLAVAPASTYGQLLHEDDRRGSNSVEDWALSIANDLKRM